MAQSKTTDGAVDKKNPNPGGRGPGRPRKAVIFWSKNASMNIGAESLQKEKRNPISGLVEVRSKMICFHNHVYKTVDQDEVAHIRATHSYRIKKIKEITQGEYEKLLYADGKPEMVSSVVTSPGPGGQHDAEVRQELNSGDGQT